MAKKQGKVKSLPVKEVTEGMQVRFGARIDTISEILKHGDNVGLCVLTNPRIVVEISSLRVFVVEYCNTTTNNKGDIWDEGIKQIPLKYKQWQAAIDNGEVDSDKIVDFEIIKQLKYDPPASDLEIIKNRTESTLYAKIIPQKKEETWFSIDAIGYKEWQEKGGISTFEPWYMNWLEDNYHPPKRKI